MSGVSATGRFVRREVVARPDDPEGPGRPGPPGVGAGRKVKCPRQQPAPGRGRPAKREGEQDDVIAPVVVALEFEVSRRLRRAASTCRATFPSMSRGTSTWPRSARFEQVASPQQAIGMEVGDPQRPVERARAIGGQVGGGPTVAAQAGFGPADHRPPARLRGERHRRRDRRTETDGDHAAPGAHDGAARTAVPRSTAGATMFGSRIGAFVTFPPGWAAAPGMVGAERSVARS